MDNPYNKYQQNAVFTATKAELTLMLYEGALKFCNQAISAIESKDFIKCNELIIKVENIVRELQITLDRKYDISKQLDALYSYVYDRLVEGNMRKDILILEEVRELLREFRDMWKELMKVTKPMVSEEFNSGFNV